VFPTTVIAEMRRASGEPIPILACVWGTILELNHSITPDILFDDPLLDGYLAVILPSGPFPPRISDSLKDTSKEESAAQPPEKISKLNGTDEKSV